MVKRRKRSNPVAFSQKRREAKKRRFAREPERVRNDRRRWADTRRARKLGAAVGVVRRDVIYERDHHTCRICREAVVMEAKVPHPLAPTLDHIVALSRGGAHAPENIQLAHFRCNVAKGAA